MKPCPVRRSQKIIHTYDVAPKGRHTSTQGKALCRKPCPVKRSQKITYTYLTALKGRHTSTQGKALYRRPCPIKRSQKFTHTCRIALKGRHPSAQGCALCCKANSCAQGKGQSIPNISFVIFNAIFFQKCAVFILECQFLMMDFLI